MSTFTPQTAASSWTQVPSTQVAPVASWSLGNWFGGGGAATVGFGSPARGGTSTDFSTLGITYAPSLTFTTTSANTAPGVIQGANGITYYNFRGTSNAAPAAPAPVAAVAVGQVATDNGTAVVAVPVGTVVGVSEGGGQVAVAVEPPQPMSNAGAYPSQVAVVRDRGQTPALGFSPLSARPLGAAPPNGGGILGALYAYGVVAAMIIPMATYSITAAWNYVINECLGPLIKLVGYWVLLAFVILCVIMIMLNPVLGSMVVVVFVVIAVLVSKAVMKALRSAGLGGGSNDGTAGKTTNSEDSKRGKTPKPTDGNVGKTTKSEGSKNGKMPKSEKK